MDIEQITVPEFFFGHGTVGTTREQITTAAHVARKYVKVKADLGNGDNVFVGGVGVANTGDTQGYTLDAGEEVEIPVDRANKVWVIGGDADQGYSWLVI
mgnify:CR=1 FL=1